MMTLNHAIWFHHPSRVDEWLLYAVDTPFAAGGRALVRGQFYRRDGTLVASTIQEGISRQRLRIFNLLNPNVTR